MSFPTFLGIGVPKAGTSWLNNLLGSHPQIWIPQKRKETYYFSDNYDRGKEWYKQFFPKSNDDKIIGEITPNYIYHPDAPKRIKKTGITKFIVLLRDPVERAFSYYKHYARIENYSKSFKEFLDENNNVIERGYYTVHLNRYFDLFNEDSFLFLNFEYSVKNIDSTKVKLAQFLEIPVDKFLQESGNKVHNKGYLPKFPRLYSKAANFGDLLRENDFYFIENLLKNIGKKTLLARKNENKNLITEDVIEMKKVLYETYEEEFEKIKGMGLVDISPWEQHREKLFNNVN